MTRPTLTDVTEQWQGFRDPDNKLVAVFQSSVPLLDGRGMLAIGTHRGRSFVRWLLPSGCYYNGHESDLDLIPATRYRDVTPDDIGKMVEVSHFPNFPTDHTFTRKLQAILHKDYHNTGCYVFEGVSQSGHSVTLPYARIKEEPNA